MNDETMRGTYTVHEEFTHEDPLDAARGIVFAVLFGIVFWTGVCLAMWHFA